MRLSFIPKNIKDSNEMYVVLKYSYKSEQTSFSPGVKCLRIDFNKIDKDNPIRKSDKDYAIKNDALRAFKQSTFDVIAQIESRKLEPLPTLVALEMKKKTKAETMNKRIESIVDSYSIVFLMKEYLKFIEIDGYNRNNRSVKYRLKIVEEFILAEYSAELNSTYITEDFFKRLLNYLIQRKAKSVHTKLSNTTIVKIIQQFRQMLNWAKRRKMITDYFTDFRHSLNTDYKEIIALNIQQLKVLVDYRGFDYKQPNDSDGKPGYLKHYIKWPKDSYLIKDERLKTIRNKDTKIAIRDANYKLVGAEPLGKFKYFTTYEVILDMFLFSCATGLRYSDLVRLKVGSKDFNKNVYPIIQKKTQRAVEIKENSLSRRIFVKYAASRSYFQYLFPLQCKNDDLTRDNYNTKANKHIKAIFEILEFKEIMLDRKINGKNQPFDRDMPLHKLVSFHTGRKTFSSIANEANIDPFSIANAMGHSGLDMTKKYVKPISEELINMFAFADVESKVSNNEKPNSETPQKEKDIESQLAKLKDWVDKGLLTNEAYLAMVAQQMEKIGFK
ncbi:MAG: tyrosine-type recombinase/integrase [Cytophagales bacterium]|nr:tyrosine-type recombinase/integrase [Cytophagales bacterium]